MSGEHEGTYVYGVVRSGVEFDALEREGDELPKVCMIEVGDLAAISSDLPADDEAATRDHVLAHSRVLAAAVQSAAVVPLRFGMVFPSDEAIRDDLLEARHDDLAELLDRFEDKVQMTLKVYYQDDAILREVVSGNSEIGRLRDAIRGRSEEESHDARLRLGELVNAAIDERRERDSAEILNELKRVTVAGIVDSLEKELMVLNAPLLVERRRLEEFEAAVDEAAQARGELMHFKLLGPMPAYHFIDVPEPAWA
jgi:hypothetical protein